MPDLSLPFKKAAVRKLILSVTSLDAANLAMDLSATPELPLEGLTSIPFLAEAASRDVADPNHDTNDEASNATIAERNSKRDAVAHRKVNDQGNEASTALAPSTDEAAVESDVNGHRENPITAKQRDDLLPPDKTDYHEQDSVAEKANDHVSVAPITLNGISTMNLIPLTNDHQEKQTTATITSDHFDDIWSPATKLKRRLEDTKDLIVCPGVYDGFSARIALSVGFDAMYMVLPRLLAVS